MSTIPTIESPQFERLLRASRILIRHLQTPNEFLLQAGEKEGCSSELAYLVNAASEWLDDELFYDELTWEIETGRTSLDSKA